MEEHVFPKAPVGPLLRKGYIEARLHTDGHGAHRERILALQAKYGLGNKALPTFVIVDPATGKALGLTRGKRSQESFSKFLSGPE